MVGGFEGEVNLDRDEILRRLEVWLDSVLADEEPPQGLSAEIMEQYGASITG